MSYVVCIWASSFVFAGKLVRHSSGYGSLEMHVGATCHSDQNDIRHVSERLGFRPYFRDYAMTGAMYGITQRDANENLMADWACCVRLSGVCSSVQWSAPKSVAGRTEECGSVEGAPACGSAECAPACDRRVRLSGVCAHFL